MTTSDNAREHQVAVLIDFENVGLNSVQWLFDQISDIGRIIVKRAYADWTTAGGKRDQLLELGIEPIHLFHSGSGKNSSDIRLAIDAVDLQHLSPVDTFVIVSSDSDFVPLVSKLRAAGKTVIGAGRRAAASRTLVISCDRYFYMDRPDRPAAPARPSHKPQPDSILIRAARAAMDEQGMVNGGRLHQTIQRLDPSFDYHALGYSTFTRYLEASSEVRVTRPRGRGEVNVELADLAQTPEPEPAGTDTLFQSIDEAWQRRAPAAGQQIHGNTAAGDAAKALAYSKLSDSPYKTLQRLLDSSKQLSLRWIRDRSRIIRR